MLPAFGFQREIYCDDVEDDAEFVELDVAEDDVMEDELDDAFIALLLDQSAACCTRCRARSISRMSRKPTFLTVTPLRLYSSIIIFSSIFPIFFSIFSIIFTGFMTVPPVHGFPDCLS